jgi:AraC-like DNA-binding protein
MNSRESITIWHLPEFGNTEIHRGTSVARSCPRHWHEQFHLCAIETGGGKLFYRGKTHQTPAGALFIVHPGEVHANEAYDESGCTYRNLYLDVTWFQSAATEVSGKAQVPFFPAAVLFERETLRTYLQLHRSLELSSSRLERETRFLDLFDRLMEIYAAVRPAISRAGRERLAVKRAREFLEGNFAENVSLARLSEIANVSPYHLNRVFSEELGLPPHAYQTQVRIAKAKTLLREGWGISDAALLTGFSDQSHLTRHFKKFVGVAPGEYARSPRILELGIRKDEG